MSHRCGRNLAIEGGKRPTAGFGGGLETPPEVGSFFVHWKNAAGEALTQIVLQPLRKAAAFRPSRKSCDTFTDFSECQNTEIQHFLGLFIKPRHHAGRRPLLPWFIDDAGVEQPAHSSTLRGRSRWRPGAPPMSRSGDLARKRLIGWRGG